MSKKEKKNTLLFSVGPHQVITQYVLAKQVKLSQKIIGVIRTTTAGDGLIMDKGLKDCEDYVNRILKLNDVIYLESIYKLWGGNKFEKLINLPVLKKRIRDLVAETNINVDYVENIILAARFDLGEVLLLSVFKNLKNIYLVSDGNPKIYANKIKFKIPFYLTIFGYNNPYKEIPKVFFHPNNLPNKPNQIVPKVIDDNINDSVKEQFLSDVSFNNWLSESLPVDKTVNKTLFFLQPLDIHIDYEVISKILIKILKSELKKTDNEIIIKYHPRERKNTLIRFQKSINAIFGDRIVFFDDSYFSRLPVEIYFKKLNINRVITMYSSASLFSDNVEVVYYSSNLIPKKFRDVTEYLANSLQQKVNYV